LTTLHSMRDLTVVGIAGVTGRCAIARAGRVITQHDIIGHAAAPRADFGARPAHDRTQP
jgi:hypothetical protein